MQQYLAFWKWFQANFREIDHALAGEGNRELLHELDRRVRRFTRLDWEIGPDEGSGGSRFSFAPANEDELKEAEQIVQAADGVVLECVLMPFRAPKSVLPSILVEANAVNYLLELARWRYALIGYDAGRFFDVEVWHGWQRIRYSGASKCPG